MFCTILIKKFNFPQICCYTTKTLVNNILLNLLTFIKNNILFILDTHTTYIHSTYIWYNIHNIIYNKTKKSSSWLQTHTYLTADILHNFFGLNCKLLHSLQHLYFKSHENSSENSNNINIKISSRSIAPIFRDPFIIILIVVLYKNHSLIPGNKKKTTKITAKTQKLQNASTKYI